eukprot:scaffold83821_cov30-Attheya_sp.AAC.1
MADLASTRQLLVRMRFTNAAAAIITDEQGIDEMSEIKILTDSEIEGLCKVVRRPGGTIPNPKCRLIGMRIRATFRVSNASFNRICSAVQTSRRQRRAQRREIYAFKENGDDQGGRTETDSHANTSVVGKECLVFHDFERPVNVSGFDSSLGTVNDRSVVSAALAYEDPTTREVIIV